MSVKPFDLVPVVERALLFPDKPKSQVECMDCSSQNLYVVTTDSYLMHYVIQHGKSPSGKVTFQCGLRSQRHLGLKKHISQLVTAPDINKLLVVFDGVILTFQMYGLEVVSPGMKDKFKGVTCICRNDNPTSKEPMSVELCIGTRRKTVILVIITKDQILPVKEISVPEMPIRIESDGAAVCMASASNYYIINLVTEKVQPLFSYESDSTKALIMKVGMEEFLLSGPTNMIGMFVTSVGTSQRPPLSWPDGLVALGYSFPYVLVLGKSTVTVHSILGQDQKPQKQSMPFKDGKLLLNHGEFVLISSGKEIYSLVQNSFQNQIKMLFNEKRVTEALELAHVASVTDVDSKNGKKFLEVIHQQAGFIYLSQGLFVEAGEMFREGGLDVRELIALYPTLLPSSSQFVHNPSLHSIKDINSLVRGSKRLLAEAKQFLVEYLEVYKGLDESKVCEKEVDTALVKMYSELNCSQLLELVQNENSCDYEETVVCLKTFEKHHALGLYYSFHKDLPKTLDIWTKIANGSLRDSSFPGFEFVINVLKSLQDYDLLWQFVPWAMDKNQELAVKIFTERTEEDSERLKPDLVIEYLQSFPAALETYLEHLVFNRDLQKEKYHTHLAVLYLDAVLKMKADTSCSLERLDNGRMKLRHLLEVSTLYRVSLLVSKISQHSDLDAEEAILYGKMGQHEKALKILVYKLQDYQGAERYCKINSEGREAAFRQSLFQILLSVYLTPECDHDPLVVPAVNLLNSQPSAFDRAKVLQLVPEDWSIGLIAPFLFGTLETSLHEHHVTKIYSNLAKSQCFQAKHKYVQTISGGIHLSDERLCQACRRPFTDTAVARYPNGTISHIHCARQKTVCPVTGKIFTEQDDD